MYKDKSNKWLIKAIRAHKRVIFDCYQYKYFMLDKTDFDRVKQELADIVHELKLMQAELMTRRGRF
jgi:hypothetical protein